MTASADGFYKQMDFRSRTRTTVKGRVCKAVDYCVPLADCVNVLGFGLSGIVNGMPQVCSFGVLQSKHAA
jgi:hypothetical protein